MQLFDIFKGKTFIIFYLLLRNHYIHTFTCLWSEYDLQAAVLVEIWNTFPPVLKALHLIEDALFT
jgi:hypothetical protein